MWAYPIYESKFKIPDKQRQKHNEKCEKNRRKRKAKKK